MKKVLAIAPYPYLPFFSGGQKFIAGFYEQLARVTELTVISTGNNDASLARGYRILPLLKSSFSRYYDRSLVEKISNEAKKGGYDAIIWEHPYYAWLARRIKKNTGIKNILHTHNIEYQRFKSTGRWWWPILRNYEKRFFREGDQLLFITEEDKRFAIDEWKIDPAKCLDLPFGIDIPAYPPDRMLAKEMIRSRHGIGTGEHILLFNGLLNYKPNLDALKVILGQINPILQSDTSFEYKILVCGKGLPEEYEGLQSYRDRQVIYAGFVDDISLYFKAAEVFLNPVLSGGGIKTKMVEAIGYGTTVVATETGAKGIRKEVCGDKLIVVKDEDWNAFTNAVKTAAGMNKHTPAEYYSYYNWENIVSKFVATI